MAVNSTCTADKNLVAVYIDNVKIGYVTEVGIDESYEVTEEPYFGGVAVDEFAYPKTTITLNRLIRYNMTTEQQVLDIINCMRTDPKTMRFVVVHVDMDSATRQKGKLTQSYKNCRLSSHKRTLKPTEAFSQELEFKSEGLLTSGSSTDDWEKLDMDQDYTT